MKAKKFTKRTWIGSRRLISFPGSLLLLFVALTASVRGTSSERYWWMPQPVVTVPEALNGNYLLTVVNLRTKTNNRTSRLTEVALKISLTAENLFQNILTISATCNVSTPLRPPNRTTAILYYPCRSVSISKLEEDTFFTQQSNLSSLYLRSMSGSFIQSLNSIKTGFALTNSLEFFPDYQINFYPTNGTLKDVTNFFDQPQFPTQMLLYSLAAQLGLLLVLFCISDKRRVPIFSIYMIGVGYIPLVAVIRRATFVEPGSSYYKFGMFFVVSLAIAVFACLPKVSRRRRVTYHGGLITLIITSILFVSGTIGSQGASLGVLVITVIALVVEKCRNTGHIHLAIITNLILGCQIYVYAIAVRSQITVTCTMMIFNWATPTPLGAAGTFWFLAFFCLCGGGHVSRGNWEEVAVVQVAPVIYPVVAAQPSEPSTAVAVSHNVQRAQKVEETQIYREGDKLVIRTREIISYESMDGNYIGIE